MSENEVIALVNAADRLAIAAKKTYSSKGLGLTQLLIAINEYELTKNQLQDSINAELEQFEKYFTKAE